MKISLFFLQILLILFVYFIQAPAQTLDTNNPITIIAKSFKLTKDEWQFEINIKNKGSKSIYLATEPTQVNGKIGQYLLLDKKDNSLLSISTRVFPPLLGDYYSNDTRVKLIKLMPEEAYIEIISLNFPLRETNPPLDSISEELISRIKNKTVTDEDFKSSGEKNNPLEKC